MKKNPFVFVLIFVSLALISCSASVDDLAAMMPGFPSVEEAKNDAASAGYLTVTTDNSSRTAVPESWLLNDNICYQLETCPTSAFDAAGTKVNEGGRIKPDMEGKLSFRIFKVPTDPVYFRLKVFSDEFATGPFMTGTTSANVGTNMSVNLSFNLVFVSDQKGSIALPVDVGTSGIDSFSIKQRNGTDIVAKTLISDDEKLTASEITPGSYDSVFYFYAGSSLVLTHTESLLVYAGTVTDKWASYDALDNGPLFLGPLVRSTFYVLANGQTGFFASAAAASDTNAGSPMAPLKTLGAALAKCSGSDPYTIVIKGNFSDSFTVPAGKDITIQPGAAAPAATWTVSGKATLYGSSLKLKNGVVLSQVELADITSFLKLDDGYEAASVSKISLVGADSYMSKAGLKIIELGTGASLEKFSLVLQNGTADVKNSIVVDTADARNGVIMPNGLVTETKYEHKKCVFSVSMTPEKNVKMSIALDGNTVAAADVSEASMTLYQDGDDLSVSWAAFKSTKPPAEECSITIPDWMPKGDYHVYATAKVKGIVYDAWIKITVN